MYRKHFGLTRHPFGKEIEPDDLFASAAGKELEARLGHLIEMRGIGLVTGEAVEFGHWFQLVLVDPFPHDGAIDLLGHCSQHHPTSYFPTVTISLGPYPALTVGLLMSVSAPVVWSIVYCAMEKLPHPESPLVA